jgi:hypothetical protein
MGKLIEFLEHHQVSCFYKKYLGVECPGCGMQRSFVYLLKGDFIQSLKMYPALIPTMFMFFFLILHIIFKFEKGHKVLLILFIFNVFLMLSNFIFKLLI